MKPAIDLAALDLKELKQLQRDVAQHIASYEDRRRKEAAAAADAAAREFGFSLSELLASQDIPKKPRMAPRYANPASPDQTWSGHGRRPQWFAAAMASGMTPEELEIEGN